MELVDLIVAIVAGVCTCVPLVISLIKYIKKASKEKNWGALVALVMNLIAEAESNYREGASKKQYVVDGVKSLSNTVGVEISDEELNELIDNMVSLSKKVNVKK